MKKIGIISLALVLALGALGAAYAPWTDDIEIVQVVQTGYLEVGVWGDAWLTGDTKDVAEVIVTKGEPKFEKDTYPFDFFESITVTVNNLYPSVTVGEQFYIGVGGTVPVHMYATVVTDEGWDALYACMDFVWALDFPDQTELVEGEGLEALLRAIEGYQIHDCQNLGINISKHLQQCAPQGVTGSFTLTVTAYQYNYTPEP